MILIEDLTFCYGAGRSPARPLFSGFNLRIASGEHVVLAGPNGAGKSTLLHLMKGLLAPQGGRVSVEGRPGLLLSSPVNQSVLPVVEDDVAFGPENEGASTAEIGRRVEEAHRAVGGGHLRRSLVHQLSGGEQQLINLAGILAMRPDSLLADEATAMLDPGSKRRVRGLIRRLHREEGWTVVEATHDPLEILAAQRIVVLAAGGIAFDGPPRALLDREALVSSLGLAASELPKLLQRLRRAPASGDDPVGAARGVVAERWGIDLGDGV